ncbi:hypothetical protein [Streptosporangium sp. NPDC002721]|uniref:hypothetical protein n=1 Tax=Streptosporangium sp. NPDC002721 TaxID=3366188 RepID=UPI0036BEB742
MVSPGALISTCPRRPMLGARRLPAGKPVVSVVVWLRPPQYRRAYVTCAPAVSVRLAVLELNVVASPSTSMKVEATLLLPEPFRTVAQLVTCGG